MALNIGRTTVDGDEAVRQISSRLLGLCDLLTTLRASVVAASVDSALLQQVWVNLVGAGPAVAAQVTAVGGAALTAAYARKFNTAGGYDPSAQWTSALATLNTLIANLKAGMPKDSSGRPVFAAYDANNNLASFAISLTGGQVTTLTSNIDSALGSFT